ncbi:hypothetical protein HYDPIDRAFT_26797 [Hydnomerulius pinastri MD-312]|nr:hypothetical protein HYDPIDRAFT_26797 [Hydnomerulius pinastri MD-312]
MPEVDFRATRSLDDLTLCRCASPPSGEAGFPQYPQCLEALPEPGEPIVVDGISHPFNSTTCQRRSLSSIPLNIFSPRQRSSSTSAWTISCQLCARNVPFRTDSVEVVGMPYGKLASAKVYVPKYGSSPLLVEAVGLPNVTVSPCNPDVGLNYAMFLDAIGGLLAHLTFLQQQLASSSISPVLSLGDLVTDLILRSQLPPLLSRILHGVHIPPTRLHFSTLNLIYVIGTRPLTVDLLYQPRPEELVMEDNNPYEWLFKGGETTAQHSGSPLGSIVVRYLAYSSNATALRQWDKEEATALYAPNELREKLNRPLDRRGRDIYRGSSK